MNMRHSLDSFYIALTVMDLSNIATVSGENTGFRDVAYLNLIATVPMCTVSKLASMLKVSKPTVTVKVNSLVEQGLVIKTRDEVDGRVMILKPSPRLEAMMQKDNKAVEASLNKLREMHTEEQMILFCRMLDELSSFLIESSENSEKQH